MMDGKDIQGHVTHATTDALPGTMITEGNREHQLKERTMDEIIEDDSYHQICMKKNVVEIDGKSCLHEVVWPKGAQEMDKFLYGYKRR